MKSKGKEWRKQDERNSNSTDEEKAKHQSFMEKVATEPGLVFASVQMMQEAKELVPGEEAINPLGSPRHLTWLLFRDPESLNAQEQSTLTFIREVHDIDITYTLAQRFLTMVREQQVDQLDGWLQGCEESGISDLLTFSEGLRREYSALKGALTFSYSNGPVEGQMNKLKYIKRSMYGRGSFELLRQKVLQVA